MIHWPAVAPILEVPGLVADWLRALPTWAVVGLGLATAFTVVATAAFLAGTRLYPDRDRTRGGPDQGEYRRRAEIRAFLRSIDEEFVEDHPVRGRPVAFYLPARDVAITFDVDAFFRIDGSDTHAILVEHELPGALLGARLPFETPEPEPRFEDRSRPGVGDPVASAFDVLGLPTDADEEAVRTAYREQVLSAHPDQGGDPEAFERLQDAYAVARTATNGEHDRRASRSDRQDRVGRS